MAGDLEIVKTIASIAAPLTNAIVETWVKPNLAKLRKSLTADKAIFENALATKFDEYLLRTYEKNSYINIIAFQNQQKKLDDIYIPLTLKVARGSKEVLVDNYREDLLPVYKKALLRDTAGMGKSTIVKYLFLSCVNQNEGIPVFIELRKLKSNEPVLTYIYNELNPVDDEFDKDFVLKLIKGGNFIFFLDGYDEIPFSERDKVTAHLQDFISKAGNNLFLLTSRPESSLASFPDFKEFNIQPLKLEEAFELLKKYDQGGDLSAEIISKLKGETLENIKEFLQNPLLVSLLYKSYEYKPIIPFKKHIFYRQVYDALFESHDLTKGGSFVREKYSALDIEDFHRALRALGFITVKLGQIEFDKDNLLALIREAKEHCPGIDFKEADFLKDLLVNIPLFIRDGDDYKWAHKSIQEYFAAQFIWLDAKDQQTKILRSMVNNKNHARYFNVLDLYYDMDYKTFRQTIIYDLVKDFVQHYDTTYTHIDREQIPDDVVHLRKLLTFGKAYICVPKALIKMIMIGKTERIDFELRKVAESSDRYEMEHVWEQGVVRLTGCKESIIRLLTMKGCDIFVDTESLPKGPDEYESLERGATKQSIYILDDSPSKFCNLKENFLSVTSILASEGMALLSPDKCRKLKLEIEREMKAERSGDFYIDL
ncbi:MAG: hypothetical protein QOH49_2576 [Acidobacteriota bacterium]|jgi:hypothetical protein|nr:hypothetical protein [Acidobacteriota bacterium]